MRHFKPSKMTPEEIVINAEINNWSNSQLAEAIKAYAREMCETALAERDNEIADLASENTHLRNLSDPNGSQRAWLENERIYKSEITELKARVAELEQGVKDAIAEMDRYYSLKLGVRILKNKLKL